MSAIFTKNYGVTNARNFERLTTSVFANTYLTFGRAQPFNANNTVTTPTDTANTFYDLWHNLIGIKKVTAADMNLVIPRVDWTANNVYTEYNEDTQMFYKASSSSLSYDNAFYVRNTEDQVFKCLYNESSANSSIMPQISIDGQLPENAYIEPGDGYKWKYMYTIPAGLKEKFFTSQFMPITSEAIVTNNAVNGRLDIIKIISGGAGFNANANSNSIQILTVSGDGSNANITAKVTSSAANGANIVNYNIISGGNNYTRATISIVDSLKIQGTANANLIPVISPPGGHGFDVATELGASNLMISIGIEGDENGVFPISTTETSSFRQIGLLIDPLLTAGGYASGTAYRGTTKYTLNQPNKDFEHGETVYVGSSLATATFTGVVEHFDTGFYYLYLTNTTGSVTAPATFIGNSSSALATVLTITNSSLEPYSGQLLYIDNTSEITRSSTETQQLKLTMRF